MNCFQHAETSLQRQGRDLTTSFARKLPDTWSLPVNVHPNKEAHSSQDSVLYLGSTLTVATVWLKFRIFRSREDITVEV